MVPTRSQIISKIDEFKADPTKSSDVYGNMQTYLKSLNLQPIIVAGQTIDPVNQILTDLDSYENY